VYFEAPVFDAIGVLKLLPLVVMDGRGAVDGVIGVLVRFLGGNEVALIDEPVADGGTYPAAALARSRSFSMSRLSILDLGIMGSFSSIVFGGFFPTELVATRCFLAEGIDSAANDLFFVRFFDDFKEEGGSLPEFLLDVRDFFFWIRSGSARFL